VHLTKRTVESVALQAKDIFAWDDELPGFGVRVYPSGRRMYLVQYRIGKRLRRMRIGWHGVVTAEIARHRARLLLSDVARGADPAAERDARRKAKTVSELADAYLELHARPRKRSVGDDEQRLKKYVRPAIGTKIAAEVTRPDVIALHRSVGRDGGDYVANRVLALVSAIWNWGEREGLLPANNPNPARGVTRFRETSRDRWLTPDEVKRVAEALKVEASPHVRAYFALALITGARKRELLSIRWADIDRGLLRIGDTKNGRPHIIPLPETASAILIALPKAGDSGPVFPSPSRLDVPLSVAVIDQAWRRIRTGAKLPEARLHDLRRTMGSWMVQGGASIPLIGRALNHKSQAATAVYARLALDGVRHALEAHANALADVGVSAGLLSPSASRGPSKIVGPGTDGSSKASSRLLGVRPRAGAGATA